MRRSGLNFAPSGAEIDQTFDGLNRRRTVDSSGEALASYGYRGGDLVARKSLGNGLAGGMTYDAARRPVVATLGGANLKPFTERLSWSPRNLKTAMQRDDLLCRGANRFPSTPPSP